MRPGLKFRWRDAGIVAVVLVAFFGLVVAVDYRVGGVERFGLWPSRLIHGTSIDTDTPLDAIETRLAERLTDPAIFDSGTEKRAFKIRDCVAVYRRVVPKRVCEGDGNTWWRTETFFDLRLLETAPFSVELDEMQSAWTAGKSSVTWQFRPEAAQRLLKLYHDYRSVSQRVRGQHPKDVTERLRVLGGETDVLGDRLFEANGRRRHYCNGVTTLLPEWRGEVKFFVLTDHAPDVIDLMHAYAVRACPFDEAALAPE